MTRPIFARGMGTSPAGPAGPAGAAGPAGPAGANGGTDASTADNVTNGTATKAALVAQINDTTSVLRVLLDSLYKPVVKPYNLPIWSAALARVLGGTGDASLLAAGDSTTAGVYGEVGANPVNSYGGPHSYPARTCQVLRDAGIPAAPGFALFGNADLRWVGGTGWSTSSGFGWNASPSTTGTLVFNPAGWAADSTMIYDRFTVYFVRNSGHGTVQIQATGGAVSTVDMSGATGVGKVTVSAGSASATNTVTFSNTTVGNIYIIGVEPYHSTIRRVRVANLGAPGTKTADWADTTSYSHMGRLNAIAPDLAIISLGINDAGTGVSSSTYSTQLGALITGVHTSRNILLAPPIPSVASQTSLTPLEAQYETVCKAKVAAGDVEGYLDFVAAVGGNPGDPTLFSGDGFHPNAAGYQAVANKTSLLTLYKS